MPPANIGYGSEKLILTAEEGALRPDELLCELRAETMSASRHVYALGFVDLAEFFESLASDWRGWTGSRACARWRVTLRSLPTTSDS
ncbi:DUF6228 family protein [Nocardioides endophyticus]|uniref:DUF6228 family protein n=1 Tax=Nocardioides endophyticus TaxID=1353775 RepID=UPI003CD0845E